MQLRVLSLESIHPLHELFVQAPALSGVLVVFGGALDTRGINDKGVECALGRCLVGLCGVEAREGKLGRVRVRHLVVGGRALDGALGQRGGGDAASRRVGVRLAAAHEPDRRV